MPKESVREEDNIQVCVRLRPLDVAESDAEVESYLLVSSVNSLQLNCKPESKIFTYDCIANVQSTQEEVFASVAKGIIDSCMAGYNGTIFAYGQTGSGKTFTMIGPSEDSDNLTHQLRGIIPRSFEYLFNLIHREQQKNGSDVEFLCKCSFLEIYNEQIYDLLDVTSATESIRKGVYVDGLSEQCVLSARDAYQVLMNGLHNRRVASTSMNRESSRSHAVFTLTVEVKEKRGTLTNIRTSQLNLVDLAGSERQKDTQAFGLRLKEAGSINKSLSALGNAIMALVDINHGRVRHVPYRDSKLTFLLRDSLGGNAKTFMIANVHPSKKCFGETLSTLNFAKRAKMIKNKAIVNEDTHGNVEQLQNEIKRLKEQLMGVKAASVGGIDILSTNDKNESWSVSVAAMEVRDKAEQEKKYLSEKLARLGELCQKKEKMLQSTKMILKFRESLVSRLEANRDSSSTAELADSRIELMQKEIEQLQYQIEHHPDVTRFAAENLELRAALKRLKSCVQGDNQLAKDLASSRQYTLLLERKIRNVIGNKEETEQKDVVTKEDVSEIESLRKQKELLQLELDKSKQESCKEMEAANKRIAESEMELASTKKMINEMEKVIKALQLKHNMERNALNDRHMKTLKTITTPTKKNGRLSYGSPSNRSYLDTPKSNGDMEESKNCLTPLSTPKQKIAAVTASESDVLEAEKCAEALAEELGVLQKKAGDYMQRTQEQEIDIMKLQQENEKLQQQRKLIEERLEAERNQNRSREMELNQKLTALTTNLHDEADKSKNFQSEVMELNLKLSEALAEYDLLQLTKEESGNDYSTRLANLDTKLIGMELELSSKESELSTVLEEKQTLQNELETLEAEVNFTRHMLHEVEQRLSSEMKTKEVLNEEIVSLTSKFDLEKQTNRQLLARLQKESDNIEMVKDKLSENTALQIELTEVSEKCQEQANIVTRLERNLQDANSNVLELQKQDAEHKNEISGLVVVMRDLKKKISEKDERLISLQGDLEEATDQLDAFRKYEDEQNALVNMLREKVTKLEEKHAKIEASYKLEVEALMDDNESLSTALEEQTLRLSTSTDTIRSLTEKIRVLEEKLKVETEQLERVKNDYGKRLQDLQNETLRDREEKLSALIEDYENRRKEKNEEIQSLKAQLTSQGDLDLLLKKYSELEREFEAETAEWNDKFQIMQLQLQEATARAVNATTEMESSKNIMDDILQENKRLQYGLENVEDELSSSRLELEKALNRLSRFESLEKKYFDELQTVTSELESNKEQNIRLEKVINELNKRNEELTTEMEKLVGQRNYKQRIQHHTSIKRENNQLKETMVKLKNDLALKTEHCKTLMKQLESLGKTPLNKPHLLGPVTNDDKENCLTT